MNKPTTYYNDIEPFCCAVLRQNIANGYLPGGYVDERDITTVSASELVGYQHVHLFAGIGGFPLGFLRARVSHELRILTEGFPCQDISPAGNLAGITGERSGLWKQSARIIKESSEAGSFFDYIVIENSSNLLSGADEEKAPQTQATNPGMLYAENQWAVDDPTVIAFFNAWAGEVFGDLADAGYDASWRVLRASDFGAPHIRARAIIVAYPQGTKRKWCWISWDRRSGDPDPRGVGLANPTGERWGTWRSESAEQQGWLCPAGCSEPLGRCGTMANSGSNRCGIRQNQQKCESGSVGLADAGIYGAQGVVANPSSTGRAKQHAATLAGEQGHTPWRNFAPGRLVASATSRRERQHQITRGASGTQRLTLQPSTGTIEPGLGGSAPRLPNWLDGYRWPAGRGSEQHSWEPARVVAERVPHRNARIKALGNAIVPAVAEYIGRCIMAAEAEMAGVA